MIAEALEALAKMATEAVKPQSVVLDKDPRRVFVNTGNKLEEVKLNPAPRAHGVESLQDLIAAANNWGTAGVVWHNHSKVVLVVNDSERYDTVTFSLLESHAFKKLLELDRKQMRIGQRDFIQLLRHDLAGKVPDDLLPKVRKIEATSSGKGVSEIQHGRERGTREFQAEIVGATNIPEVVDASVTVYQNVPELPRFGVRLSLDITLPPQAVDFLMQPLPDELANIMRASQSELHELLTEGVGGIPVFFGTP